MQLKAKIKVIIAEDEPAIMHTIAAKIQEIDSDFLIVEQCTNGLDALQAVHLHRPDVLLTDIKMPVMDGLDLAKNTSLQYPNTRIVIISGYFPILRRLSVTVFFPIWSSRSKAQACRLFCRI